MHASRAEAAVRRGPGRVIESAKLILQSGRVWIWPFCPLAENYVFVLNGLLDRLVSEAHA